MSRRKEMSGLLRNRALSKPPLFVLTVNPGFLFLLFARLIFSTFSHWCVVLFHRKSQERVNFVKTRFSLASGAIRKNVWTCFFEMIFIGCFCSILFQLLLLKRPMSSNAPDIFHTTSHRSIYNYSIYSFARYNIKNGVYRGVITHIVLWDVSHFPLRFSY